MRYSLPKNNCMIKKRSLKLKMIEMHRFKWKLIKWFLRGKKWKTLFKNLLMKSWNLINKKKISSKNSLKKKKLKRARNPKIKNTIMMMIKLIKIYMTYWKNMIFAILQDQIIQIKIALRIMIDLASMILMNLILKDY